jgi:uncharacterized protein
MQISGTYAFAAPPATVWAAIYEPQTLKACIPQCEKIERVRPDFWLGRAVVGIGPLTVGFDGEITLSDVTPPERYIISILAKSWMGKANGSAAVNLVATAQGGTELRYTANVQIGIKLLDKAMTLAEGVAKDLADKFFSRLVLEIAKTPSRSAD